jgi:ribonucleoside-diphosphate reductase alpha chain
MTRRISTTFLAQPLKRVTKNTKRRAESGELKLFKRVEAAGLWRKMLTMLFQTEHPWISFKKPLNIRSPQSHAGVVHSSILCTEILLNSSRDETALCNLGFVNLKANIFVQ